MPPVFESDWASRWPVGEGFVAHPIDSEILIWGGIQKQPNGNLENLPRDVIFIFNVKSKEWKTIQASGDIPPHPFLTASVLLEDTIYIFGGFDRSSRQKTNEIYALNPTSGVFTRLPVQGDRPSPRGLLKGWTYKGQLFFFIGVAEESESEVILVGDQHDGVRDNLLCRFDVSTNTWTKVETRGDTPSPREDYAAAVVDHQVIIHGGYGGRRVLNDTHMLDMKSMTWTLVSTGGPKDYGHSLTPLTEKRVLFVGGSLKQEIWIFDVSENIWQKQEASLPQIIAYHEAVMVETVQGVSVVCLGGWDYNKKYPDKMIVLDIE